MTDRRKFLATALAGPVFAPGLVSLANAEFTREKGAHISPAVAAYSFRSFFEFMKEKPNKSLSSVHPAIDMKQFIQYCAKHDVGAELTSYFFPPEVSDKYLAECRREAHINGVGIAGTAVGNQFTLDPDSDEGKAQMDYVKKWVDRSVLMGAPHIRVFAGKIPKGMDESVAEGNAIRALGAASDYAASKGVMLGIENHDSIGSAEKLLRILEKVDNPWLGVNLDSGNFRTDDPYADFEACVPHAINVQLKTEIAIDGKKVPADLERFISLLKKGNYRGFAVLEFEESTDPFEHVPPLLEKLKGYIAS